MRLPALLAVLTLAAADPALAQTAPADGVTVAETRAWLIGQGGVVAEPEAASGRMILKVADTLPWVLAFYACADRCDDVQFEASVTGPVPETLVTEWNRENRFAKAVWIAPATPGGEAKVMLQYDVLLTESGPEQLDRATSVWLQQLTRFVRTLQSGLQAGPTP